MDKIQNVVLSVVGVTFPNDDGSNRGTIISELMHDDTTVRIEREPNNQYDRNAIKVVANDLGQIGYIGKDYAAILAPMMDNGDKFETIVYDYGVYKNRPYCKLTINQI